MKPVYTSLPARGIALTDVIVSTALMALIVATATKGIADYYGVREHERWYRAAAWAAEAQLQRYQAGVPIDTPMPDGMFPPEVTVRTSVEPGQGQWQGFGRMTVTATATTVRGRTVRRQFRGYVRTEKPK